MLLFLLLLLLLLIVVAILSHDGGSLLVVLGCLGSVALLVVDVVGVSLRVAVGNYLL